MSELVVRGLEKSYGDVWVLRGVDLAVPEGSLAAVLGASGCGKTTLLRIVAGFDTADRGMVRLGGTVVSLPGTHVPPERRRVGVVPQEGALFPHLTVAGNVGFGLPRRRRGARVDEVLELVGLAGYGPRMPYELSGGQQQRVALARALAPQPRVLLTRRLATASLPDRRPTASPLARSSSAADAASRDGPSAAGGLRALIALSCGGFPGERYGRMSCED